MKKNEIIIKKVYYNEKNTLTELIIAYLKEKVYNT